MTTLFNNINNASPNFTRDISSYMSCLFQYSNIVKSRVTIFCYARALDIITNNISQLYSSFNIPFETVTY